MTSNQTGSALPTLVPANERDRPVISNLLQLMLYDLSPLYGEWIGRDGRYTYEWLDYYWVDQDRFPYLICREGQLAGFALVMAHSPISGRAPCWFMAEFFVLKAQRRRGYGQVALNAILSRHNGNWEIAVMDINEGAASFWKNALSKSILKNWKKEPVTHKELEWTVHSFVT